MLLASVFLALGVSQGHAQATGDSTAGALRAARAIPAGRVVRVRHRNGSLMAGRFQGVVDGALAIDSSPAFRIAPGDVDSLWIGRRATKRGAKTGAIAGGIAGGVALAGFSAVMVTAFCETQDCDVAGPAAVGGLIGAVIGSGSGALIGAVIGSGVPSWKLAYVANMNVPRAGDPGRLAPASTWDVRYRERHATFRFTMPYGIGADAGSYGGALGARIGFLPRFGRTIWAGFEAASQGIGSWKSPQLGVVPDDRSSPPRLFVYIDDMSVRVLQFAGAVRMGRPSGTVRPYLTGSLGVNLANLETRSFTICTSCSLSGEFHQPPGLGGGWSSHFGASLGGGVDVMPAASSLSVGVEVRGHIFPRFLTLGLSVGTSW